MDSRLRKEGRKTERERGRFFEEGIKRTSFLRPGLSASRLLKARQMEMVSNASEKPRVFFVVTFLVCINFVLLFGFLDCCPWDRQRLEHQSRGETDGDGVAEMTRSGQI